MSPTTVSDVTVSLLGRDDVATVDAAGRRIHGVIDGVEIKPMRPHVDPRGSLVEVINFDDPFWREPIVYSYAMTIKPGRIKGWGMHLRQIDRHVLMGGELRLVLYDARSDSPTHGTIQIACLSDEAKGAVRIPCGVWHAAQNVGDTMVHLVNFPTIAYDRDEPDKQLLPIGTDQIPFEFGGLDGYGR
jgi:dTDP-4-dehydrorhamnose 3,5-epimerase